MSNQVYGIGGIISSVHQRCLRFRAMDRLVKTAEFADAFAIDGRNPVMLIAVENGNVDTVERWIRSTLQAEKTLRELRDQAKRLNIPNYTQYNKDELLIEIAQYDSGIKKAAGPMPCSPG